MVASSHPDACIGFQGVHCAGKTRQLAFRTRQLASKHVLRRVVRSADQEGPARKLGSFPQKQGSGMTMCIAAGGDQRGCGAGWSCRGVTPCMDTREPDAQRHHVGRSETPGPGPRSAPISDPSPVLRRKGHTSRPPSHRQIYDDVTRNAPATWTRPEDRRSKGAPRCSSPG